MSGKDHLDHLFYLTRDLLAIYVITIVVFAFDVIPALLLSTLAKQKVMVLINADD